MPSQSSCGICGNPLGSTTVVCVKCLGITHKDCFDHNGKCPIFACGSGAYLTPKIVNNEIVGWDQPKDLEAIAEETPVMSEGSVPKSKLQQLANEYGVLRTKYGSYNHTLAADISLEKVYGRGISDQIRNRLYTFLWNLNNKYSSLEDSVKIVEDYPGLPLIGRLSTIRSGFFGVMGACLAAIALLALKIDHRIVGPVEELVSAGILTGSYLGWKAGTFIDKFYIRLHEREIRSVKSEIETYHETYQASLPSPQRVELLEFKSGMGEPSQE